MSTVALPKRPFELLMDEPMVASPGHSHTHHAGALSPMSSTTPPLVSPSKRCRPGSWFGSPLGPNAIAAGSSNPTSPGSMLPPGETSPVHRSPARPYYNHDSVFRTSDPQPLITAENFDRFLSMRRRVKPHAAAATPAATGEDATSPSLPTASMAGTAAGPSRTPLRQSAQQRDGLFTLDEVKAVVSKALQELESQLRAEYDVILREKLAEQFENFTRFNQDYISRQLRESQWDYML